MGLDYKRCDDAELVKRVVSGDDNAFSEIYGRYYQYIYKFVLRVVKNVDSGNDITQNTFIKTFREIANFDPTLGSLKVFISTKAVGEISAYRRTIRNDLSIEDLGNLEPSVITSIMEELEKSQRSKKIGDIVASLPEKYSLPLVLSVHQELKDEDVAKVLKLPVGTVKTQLREAKKLLKTKLSSILNWL